MSKLLALDLSGASGWALFSAGHPPRFGTLDWKGQGHAEICGKFYDWLHDFYSVERWDGMAWEAPFLAPHDKVDKIKILIGLVGICFGFVKSQRHPMPYAEIGPKEVKKRMTGRQDADKADVIKACWSLGWKVKTDHEADACSVGLIAYRQIWPLARAAA
jgi:Holliday junction resolvasome RuvABC endonuclease subunit